MTYSNYSSGGNRPRFDSASGSAELDPAGEASTLQARNLLRMADYCRGLAENRSSAEARRALLRMARSYELRAIEAKLGPLPAAGLGAPLAQAS